jgi:hypothetical protein
MGVDVYFLEKLGITGPYKKRSMSNVASGLEANNHFVDNAINLMCFTERKKTETALAELLERHVTVNYYNQRPSHHAHCCFGFRSHDGKYCVDLLAS